MAAFAIAPLLRPIDNRVWPPVPPRLPAADNGSGGDESAAIKRKRMAPDSSSGEGSGAGPRGEDATAMFTAAGGDEGVGNDAAAGLAPAAQAQQQLLQQLHVQKDPAKLHSLPSSGDLQEEGTAPPAVKRTRNP